MYESWSETGLSGCFHTTKHNAKETCDGMRVQPAAITVNPLRNGNPRYVCSMYMVV